MVANNSRQFIVLLADNDPDFLETRAEFLENEGYRVLRADSPERARQLLSLAHVHLAVLDMRMVNDDDEKDTSGLTLAKDPAYKSVPKIIFTNFPTYEDVREALGPVLDGLPPAVDFVAKREGPEAMIEAVKQASDQYVRLNWELDIQSDHRDGLFLYLIGLLHLDLPPEVILRRSDELKDLFRQLFRAYRQIRVGETLWNDHHRFCLPVFAQSTQGALDPRILVCGELSWIEQDIARFRELAPDAIQATKLLATITTTHFGAALYTLPTADLETVQPLRELFKRNRERPLKTAFDHLLKEVLTSWHRRGQMLAESHGLMSLYRRYAGLEVDNLSPAQANGRLEALVQAVRALSAVEVERDGEHLIFHFPGQSTLTCPDPVAAVYSPLQDYDPPIVCKISPGQLTADNVLVDDTGRTTWLTDFAFAGQVAHWWDFVCLEAMIRFDLSQASDLIAWQEFEECLVKPARLDERLPERDVVADLRTSVTLIEQIRRHTRNEIGYDDPLPYYAGLLVWVVGAIVRHNSTALYTQSERLRSAHLLLAAAMLARRLNETFTTSLPRGVLRLDDDGKVWLGDYFAGELSGQELDLLRCLYDRRSKIVSRENVVEAVFNESYEGDNGQQDSRINSLVRRLRLRIEPNPDRPRYIHTLKGKGYRLQVEGED